MAIQVFCNCGNSLSVGVELAGKKVRCKACKEVLKIPDVPLDASAEEEPTSGPDDYEVVKADVASITCPSCGATASPEDTACLACGAEIAGNLGPLDKVPRGVLLGGVGVVLLIIVGVIGKLAWTATRPGAHVSEGMSYLAAEDYAAAKKEFKAALGYDAANSEALVGLAMVGMESKDSALISRYGKKVLDQELMEDRAEQGKLRLAFAWLKLEEKKPKQAQNQAVEARDENEDLTGEAYAIMGLADLERGETEGAIKNLEDARAAKYEDVRVFRELAALYKAKGEYGKGRSAAEKAVGLQDDDASLWLLTAELRALDGDRDAERAGLLAAIRIDAQNPIAHSRLAEVYLSQGKMEEALESAKKASDLAADRQEVQVALGRILLAHGDAEAAKEPLEKALKMGDSWEASFYLGKALVKTGDAKNGLRRMTTALRDQSDNSALHIDAAQTSIEAGAGQAAFGILKPLLDREPNNYDARVLIAKALASQPHGRTKHDEAIKSHLQAAMDIDNRRREAPLALGLHHFEQLEAEEALAAFEAGLRSNSRDRDLLYYKGWACIRARRWDDAIAALNDCLSVAPGYQPAKDKLEQAHEGKFYENN